MRIKATEWENIVSKDISDKKPLPKIYKLLLKTNNKETNDLI